MIGRILVAYDGSTLARAALEYGLDLAASLGRPLHAVYTLEPVAPPPVLADPMVAIDPTPIPNLPMHFDEQREWAEENFEKLAARAAQRGVAFTSVIEDGSLLDVLVDIANADDLVLLGKKGRFRESGVGSATRALVRRSPCPTLVVSEHHAPLARAVTVYDGTSEGKRAIVYASDLAYALQWPLEVVALPCEGLTAEEATVRAEAALPPERGEVRVVPSPVSDDCAGAIEHALAERADGALVVLGAYGESWLAELLFGSTAPKVLRKVAAPIVLVH